MSYSTAIRRQTNEERTKVLIQRLTPMIQKKTIPLKEASFLIDKTEKGFVREAKEFGFDLSEFLNEK